MLTHHFSRRTFLRGLGVTMALPWLESLPVWGDENPKDASSAPPVRFACLFAGNGFHSKEWWARGEGANMELGKVLESLRPFREKLLFLRGLYNQEALIGGIHSCQTGNILTGAHLAPAGEIKSGVSCDQVLAGRLRDQTKVPSLVLGCEPSIAAIHKNYSMIYSSHISWSSATTPTPLELYPALAFDRLFRDEVGRADKSVLDAVIEDARGLRGAVSKDDQRRLDEYLSSVREVEKRIDQPMRLRCDILVLAFRTDTTRVCTLKLNNDHSSLRFPHLKVDYMIHHLLSHTDGDEWLKVNRFFAEQVAYIAKKLDAVQEGDRTLLDNTVLLYLSSMMTGNHNNDQLPVVMLGR